jgi:hypothetical protein
VLHRHRAGEPHPRVAGWVEPRGELTNFGDRRGGRLHSAEVEGRLQRDEAARRGGRIGPEQRAPREVARVTGRDTFDSACELLVEGAERRGFAGIRGQRSARHVEHGSAIEPTPQQA